MPRMTAATVVAATAAALFLVVALLAPAADAAACKALGKQCEQWSPCCMGEYCMAQPFGCMESEGCNKDASFSGTPCTPRPMCKSFREDFNDPKALIDKYNYTGNPDDARFWREYPGADHADVVDGNLVLSLQWSDKDGRGQGATLPSLRWIQYGTISARIKVAAGPGVISSFITKTDIKDTQGDEIDFEMLGGHPQEVQTNFYWCVLIRFAVLAHTTLMLTIYLVNLQERANRVQPRRQVEHEQRFERGGPEAGAEGLPRHGAPKKKDDRRNSNQ
ncbi:hypothetical protein AMAG_04501 [Allomyces macrogynus ATCC 38327]|uniref:GH16 domain-containing protein n=1 Tax=Allomyces macrogynus (strain ATCC 38327) TaxID=578462 RepID=A0A0L0S538_ALLM3|nr:hypothetical protein AMAG_04501 [Allomyces macrogynus ATCC 38327]|eukprot:KNE57637.1 hypothetical protein AMAG_04501 [Allomyces macrogynus ATCC 38327]